LCTIEQALLTDSNSTTAVCAPLFELCNPTLAFLNAIDQWIRSLSIDVGQTGDAYRDVAIDMALAESRARGFSLFI